MESICPRTHASGDSYGVSLYIAALPLPAKPLDEVEWKVAEDILFGIWSGWKGQDLLSMIERISRSASRMALRPMRVRLSMVMSTSLSTMPSSDVTVVSAMAIMAA